MATNLTGTVVLNLGSNPGGATLTSGTAVLNNGVTTFTGLTLNKAASGYTLTATSGGVSAATTGAFTVHAATATQFAVTNPPPGRVAVGSGFSVSVAAEDGAGNIDPTFTGTVSLTLNNASGATLGGTLTATAVAGVATFTGLSLSQAGTGYTITASGGESSITTTAINVAATTTAATQLILTTAPVSPVNAGSSFGLVVTAQNSATPTPTTDTSFTGIVTLTLPTDPTGATIGGTVSVAAVAGVATFAGLTLTQAGSYTLQATSNGLTSTTPVALTVSPLAASQLVVATQPPASVAAGTGFGVAVKAMDSFGNFLSNFTGSVTLTLTHNGFGAVLGGTATATAVAGVATFPDLTLNTAGSGYVLQASSSNLGVALTSPIAVTPLAATQFVVTTQPPSPVSNGASFGVAVSAEDAFGNLVPTFTGPVSLSLASDPTGAKLLAGAVTTVNAVGGVATFSGLALNTAGIGYTLQATGTLPTVTTTAFTVSSMPPVTPATTTPTTPQIVVTTQPTNTVAGAPFGFTVSVEDAGGTVDQTFNGVVTVAIGTGSGTLGGTLTATALNGVATFSGLTLNKTGAFTLTATTPVSSGTVSATTATFNVTPAAATQMVVTTQPATAVVGAVIGGTTGIKVTIEDSFGNTVTTATNSLTIALAANPSNATLGGTATVAAVAGVATFSTLTLNRTGTNYQLVVSGTGFPSVVTVGFPITATTTTTAATRLVVTTEPLSTVGVAPATFSVSVTAEDAAGNLASGFTGTVTVALQSNQTGATATLGGTTTLAAVQGEANFTTLTLNKPGTSYTVVATATGLTSAVTTPISIPAALATKLAIATGGQPTAGTFFAAGTPITSFVVQAQDPAGNLDTTYNGNVTVSLSANPGTATIGGTTTVQAVNGVATFTGLSLNKPATGYTFIFNGLSAGGTSLTVTPASNAISIVPGMASQLVVTTQPAASTAPGNTFSTTVTAEDSAGNVTPSFTGVETLTLGNARGATLGGTLTATAVAGVATFSSLSLPASAIATGYTLQVASGSLNPATSNAFNIAIAPATQLVVKTQPPATVSGTAFGLAVNIEDATNALVPSFSTPVTVALNSGPAGATLGGSTFSATLANGVATFSGLTLTATGAYTLLITSGTLSVTTASFNITAAAATQLIVTAQPPNPTATAAAVLSTTTVGSINVSFGGGDYQSVPSVTIGAPPGTGTQATATAVLTGGVITAIVVNNPGTGYTAAPTVTIAPPGSNPLAAGNGFGLVVAAEDLNGNINTTYTGNVTLSLATGPAGVTFTPVTVGAIAGVASFSALTLPTAGSNYSFKVTSSPALTAATTSAFTVAPATTNQLVETTHATPNPVAAGSPFSLAVSAKNTLNNVDPTFTGPVTLGIASGPAGATLSAAVGSINVVGGGTGYLSPPAVTINGSGSGAIAGTPVLTQGVVTGVSVSAGGASYTAPVTVTVAPPTVQATATATITGGVVNPITPTSGGTLVGGAGYAFPPAVTVSAPPSGGTQATATATLGTGATAGVVTGITFSGGSGYTSAPTITIAPPAATATATASIGTNTNVALNTVNGIMIVNGGAGYLSPPVVTLTGGGFTSPAVASAAITNGVVNLIAFSGGSGYTSAPTIMIAPPDVTATATATLAGGSVNSITTTSGGTLNGGAGYAFPPAVTIAPPPAGGTQATATAVLGTGATAGVVVAINISGGSGYTAAPAIVIAPPSSGGTASATLTTTTTAVNGVATFSGLSLNEAGSYTFQASSGTLNASTTPVANALVVSPAAASQLVLTTQPPSFTATASATLNGTAGGTINVTGSGGNYASLPSVVISAPTGTNSVQATAAAVLTNGQVTGVTLTGVLSIAVNGGGSGYSRLSPPAVTFTDATGDAGSGAAATAVVNASGVVTGVTVTNAGSGYTKAPTITIAPPAIGTQASATATITTAGSGYTSVPTVTIAPPGANALVGGLGFSLVVAVEDAFGNLVNSTAPVTLSVATGPAGATLGGTVTEPTVGGVATFSGLTLTTATTTSTPLYTLQAKSGTLPVATTNPFAVSALPATKLAVTTQPPSSVVAVNGFTVVVTAEDPNGNIDATYNGSVTLAIGTNPGGALLGPAAIASIAVSSSGSGYTSANPPAVTIAPPPVGGIPATAIAVVSTGGAVTAIKLINPGSGYTSAPAVTIAPPSGTGNATASASATLVTTVTVNAVNGVATFNGVTLNKSSTSTLYTLTASSGSLTQATTTAVAVTAQPATQLVVTSAPTSVPSSTAFGLVISAEDANGNVDPTYNGAVSLSLATGPNGGGLFGTMSVTAVNGVATFPAGSLMFNLIGSYTISVTSGTLPKTTVGPIVVTPAAASQLVVSIPPPVGVAPNSGFNVQIIAEDSAGNFTPSFTGMVTLSLATGPAGGTFMQVMVPAVAGVATFNNLMLTTASTTGYTFVATSGSLTSVTTSAIVVNSARATQLVLTTEPPGTVSVGTGFGLVLKAEDPNGNVDPTFIGMVTVALANNPVGSTAILGGTVTVLASGGVATFPSNLTLNKVGSGYTLVASSNGLTNSIPTTAINVTAASATQLVVTTQPPSSVTAGGTFGLTVTAEDSSGNQDMNFNGSVTASLASGPSGAMFTPVSVTAVNGVATFPSTGINSLALTTFGSGYTFQVASGNLALGSTSLVTVTTASAMQLVMNSQPPVSVTAGNPFGFSAKVEDPFGNVVTGFSGFVTVSAAPGNTLGGGTLSGTLTVPVISGVATFSGISLNQLATADALQLNSTGLTPATTGTFGVTAGLATQLAITAANEPPSAVTAGSGFSLAVTAEDQFGNVDLTYSGMVTLVLAPNSTGATLTLGGMTNVAAVNGVATFSGLTLNKSGSGYTLQASAVGLTGTTTSPISVSAAQAAQLAVTTAPPLSVTVGSTFGLAVTAEDSLGNLASSFNGDVTLSLASNPGGATLGGTLTEPAVGGVATFSNLTLNKVAQGYQFQVTSNGLASATTGTTDATPAGVTQLAVTTQPASTVTAAAPFGFAVRAEDANGNLVPSFDGTVTVSLGTNPGGATVLGGTLTTTAVNGVATFSGLTLNTAGSGYTLEVSSTGFTTVPTSPFSVTAAPVAQLMVTTEPPASVAPGSAFTIAISAEDAEGNVNTSFTGNVTIAIATNAGGMGAALGGTLTVPAVGGVATFFPLNLNTPADGYTLQATSGSLITATSSAINVNAAAATQLVVTAEPPSTVIAGNPFGLVVTAEDGLGNVDQTFSGVVSLSLAGGPAGETAGGTLTATAVDGVATFFPVTLSTVGNGSTLNVTSNGLAPTTTSPIQVIAAQATQLVITTNPSSSVTSGGSFSLIVTAEDANGNVDTNASGQITLTLTNNTNGATLSGTKTVTISNGAGIFNGLSLDKATPSGGVGYTIQASSGSLMVGTSSAITVNSAAATQLVMTTLPPSSLTAGLPFNVVISAEDPNGNVDSSFTGNVVLSLATNPGGAAATLGGTLMMAAVGGSATFSGLSLDTAASGYTIQATTALLSTATSGPITVNAAAATQVVIVTNPPTTIAAGAPFSLVAQAEDQFGNLNTNDTATVTLVLNGGTSGASLGGTTTVNAFGGVATFSNLTLDRPGAGDTITVSSDGLTSATTTAIAVNVGATAQLAVTSTPPSSVLAGSPFTLQISAEDAAGNLTPSFTGLVTLSIGDNAGNSILGGSLTATAVGGVATFTGLSLNKAADNYTLLANSGNLITAIAGPIDVTAAPASQLVLSSPPPGLVTAGQTFSVTVSAEDANFNVDPTFTGSVSVAVLRNPGGSTALLSGTLIEQFVAGVATFSDLSLNKAANGYTLQVLIGNLSVQSSAINVVPAPAVQLVVTTAPSPNPVTAGSPFGVVVSAEDADGNVDPNFHGDVTLAPLTNAGGGTLSGPTTATPVNGVATFTGLSLDKATPNGASGYILQASSGSLTAGMTSAIIVNPASATHLVVTVEPPSSATIGSGLLVTVAAEDANNNVDPTFTGTVTLTLNQNGSNATLSGTTKVVAVAGVASFPGVQLSAIGGTETLLASATGLTGATTTAFSINPGLATKLAVTTVPSPSIIAGTPLDNIVVEAQDNFGDVDPTFTGNVTLTVQTAPGGTPVNITLTEPAVAGVATFSGVTIDQAELGLTLQASGGGLTPATTSAFNVVGGTATEFAVTSPPPSSVTDGSPFGLVVTAVDSFGNPDATFSGKVTLALGTASPLTVLSGTTTVTAFQGVATFFGLTLNKVSAGDTLTASSSGLASATTPPIAVTPAAPAQLVLTTAPPSHVTAGSPFGLVVAVEDPAGNLATGFNGNVTVSLVSNPGGSGAVLGGTATVAAVDGMATFTGLTLNTAVKGYVLQVSSGALVPATASAISVNAASAAQLVLLSAPPSTVNANAGFSLSVMAEDAFGNFAASFNGPVTLSLASSPGGASLGGTLTVSASAGVAVFSGVSLNAAANGSVLQVTGSGLSRAVTSAVGVIPPPATVQSVAVVNQHVSKHKTAKVIVVQFGSGVNAVSASTLSNFQLVTVANGKRHPSKGVALAHAVYNPSTFQVTLTTKKALVLTTPLQLAINVTGQAFLARLSKSGTTISSTVSILSEAKHVEPVGSAHTLDALLAHGFRPRFRHLSQ